MTVVRFPDINSIIEICFVGETGPRGPPGPKGITGRIGLTGQKVCIFLFERLNHSFSYFRERKDHVVPRERKETGVKRYRISTND